MLSQSWEEVEVSGESGPVFTDHLSWEVLKAPHDLLAENDDMNKEVTIKNRID